MLSVLVIEDDLDLQLIMKNFLVKQRLKVYSASNASEAWESLEKSTDEIAVILCDIMLPDLDGINLIRLIRKEEVYTPVIFITSKGGLEDKREAFLSGADDYLVKPIQLEELMMRINAVVKRVRNHDKKRLTIGNTILELNSYRLIIGGTQYDIPKKEFELLWLLTSFPNQIFTRNQILDKVWGNESNSTERTVDVHINRLRKILTNTSEIRIKTIHGLGYKVERRI